MEVQGFAIGIFIVSVLSIGYAIVLIKLAVRRYGDVKGCLLSLVGIPVVFVVVWLSLSGYLGMWDYFYRDPYETPFRRFVIWTGLAIIYIVPLSYLYRAVRKSKRIG